MASTAPSPRSVGRGLPEPAAPADLPAPLSEPSRAELRLEKVLGALSDPLRLEIAHRLLVEREAYDHSCGWFGFDRPKSSLTHHFRALREAGVIRQRQYGLERRSHVRVEDLDARFPGLVDLLVNWEPEAD
ncbi:hypothetical protein GCM10022221_53710 [Actinocorallia aurea]